MSCLAVFSDAVTHLAALLHAHGPACVCAACTACQQALVLYPRLDTMLRILEAWSRGEAGDHLLPEDLQYLLMLLEHDHPAELAP